MLALVLSAVLTATTPAEAVAQVKAAQPGDVVQLSGAFGALALLNAAKTGPVTVDATMASFTSLTIASSSNLIVQGGRYNPFDWHGCVYVTGSPTIRLRGLDCVGNDTNIPGVTIRGSSDVTLENSRVARAGVGVNILQSSYVTIQLSGFFGQVVDDIDVAASQHVLIKDNSFAGSLVLPGLHADIIQVMNPSTAGGVGVTDLTVSSNQMSGAANGVSAFAGGLVGCLIETNDLRMSYPQAIALTKTQGCVVRANRVSTLPGADYMATINYLESPDLVSCANVVLGYKGWAGFAEPGC